DDLGLVLMGKRPELAVTGVLAASANESKLEGRCYMPRSLFLEHSLPFADVDRIVGVGCARKKPCPARCVNGSSNPTRFSAHRGQL
ncbi:MAG TPA: hypothetical protein PL064_02965, partial [Thermogutta sp.]|nr:hypothetical protein [Thermogutta sp.]